MAKTKEGGLTKGDCAAVCWVHTPASGPVASEVVGVWPALRTPSSPLLLLILLVISFPVPVSPADVREKIIPHL